MCSQKVPFPAGPVGPRTPVSFTKSYVILGRGGWAGGKHPPPKGACFHHRSCGTRLYPPALCCSWGRVTSGAPAGCQGTVTRRCPRQGHPQRVPDGAACAQAPEDTNHLPPPRPRPHSPSRARGTNLCRLGDFCRLFCFVLRCPCNCLLNPRCIIFIADDAQSGKALPRAAQPRLVLLLRPSGREGARRSLPVAPLPSLPARA